MMIKNLSKNIVKKNIGFNLREDLNFEDDGNYFRGFDYKGLPITTLRSEKYGTFLKIRDDYLHTYFDTRSNEWYLSENWKKMYNLCDRFNGTCSEIDLGELMKTCEEVIALVVELGGCEEGDANGWSDMVEAKEILVAGVKDEPQRDEVEDAKEYLLAYEEEVKALRAEAMIAAQKAETFENLENEARCKIEALKKELAALIEDADHNAEERERYLRQQGDYFDKITQAQHRRNEAENIVWEAEFKKN